MYGCVYMYTYHKSTSQFISIHYKELAHTSTRSRRLRSPKIYSQQARDPGELIVWFQWEASRLETQEEPMFQFEFESSKNPMSQLEGSQAGGVPLYSQKGQPFCSIRVFKDQMRPTCTGEGNLLYSIQMLISSDNILTDTPRIMFEQMSGHPVAQSS